MDLRRGFTTTTLGLRTRRIALLLLTWVIIRETSLRTNGFEDGPVICPIRLLTGYPCPGCGGTRSIGAFSLGEFERAWLLNPIAFALCVIVILWSMKLPPLNKLAVSASLMFQAQALWLQAFSLSLLYGIAWIAAISRFDSAIL
jgi:hypothetical protein